MRLDRSAAHKLTLLAVLFVLFLALPATAHAQNNNNAVCACQIPNGPPNPNPYLVGYLPFYRGLDWVAYAPTIDFTKMTHLNLAFLNPPMCKDNTCTAQSDMTLTAKNLTDAGLNAIVSAAHAHGTKVLASLGGAGGDKNIMQFYNQGFGDQLAVAIDAYVVKYNLDGVDVDIEQPTQMGVPFANFVTSLSKRLKPRGKLVTAAVAQYIQAGVQDSVLQQFDIVNVMIYGNYNRSVTDMAWWADSKHIPKEKLTLGIGFFGSGNVNGRHTEINYNVLLANYPNAWNQDTVGGGDYSNGAVFNYEGETTVAKETQLGAQYGGVMIWELSGDDPDKPHSILKVIQKNLNPAEPRIPTTTPRRGGGGE